MKEEEYMKKHEHEEDCEMCGSCEHKTHEHKHKEKKHSESKKKALEKMKKENIC